MANAERGGFFETNKAEKAMWGGFAIAAIGAFIAPELVLPGLLVAGGGGAAKYYRDKGKK